MQRYQTSDKDRLSVYEVIINSEKHLITSCNNSVAYRLLGMKVASMLANLGMRDFSMRQMSSMVNLFMPLERGRTWSSASNDIGHKICLEYLIILEC